MDCAAIKKRLAILADRDWPQEWGAQENEADGDFLGWAHRYRLADTLSPTEIDQFEQRHSISLPADYRQFLIELGNGGAGPGYGLWPLGEGEDGPLPDEMLKQAATEFAHRNAWNDTSLSLSGPGEEFIPHEDYYSYAVIAGSLEIATDGCALYHLLVLTGPAAGQVWYDNRTEGKGIAPVCDTKGEIMTFGPWYESWLDGAFTRHGTR